CSSHTEMVEYRKTKRNYLQKRYLRVEPRGSSLAPDPQAYVFITQFDRNELRKCEGLSLLAVLLLFEKALHKLCIEPPCLEILVLKYLLVQRNRRMDSLHDEHA